MQSKMQRVEFAPPQGMAMPEGVGPGDEFDMVCSFRLEGDKLCLTKVGETPMPGCEESAEPDQAEQKPTYDKLMPEGVGEKG